MRECTNALAPAGGPLEVSARLADGSGLVMGLRHRAQPVEGVQFHPESVLTPEGNRLLGNFLAMTAGPERAQRHVQVVTLS